MNLFALVIFVFATEILASVPIVINTWNFPLATREAWKTLENGGTAIQALVDGCSTCEKLQCDGTVGFGGSPDENGETTLDALVFDGSTMNMGAVGGLRKIKSAIAVAKRVLENTKHSILVGNLASKFAVQMGFKEEPLSSNKSLEMHNKWVANKCQPNFWENVKPNPQKSCGPYKPNKLIKKPLLNKHTEFSRENHDTIGMITISNGGDISAGTSSNGANHKIPGRIGDSPIAGAGAYAESSIGAAVATGDGDVMMRFLPSFLAVELMRNGETPEAAAQIAINRISSKYPNFFGAVLVVNAQGMYGAACNGMESFAFCVRNAQSGGVRVEKKVCKV